MKKIKFRIDSELPAEYSWILTIFGEYIGFEVEIVNDDEDILISENLPGDIRISHFFRNTYQSGNFDFKSYFRSEPLHYNASNKPDYLSSCFYLLAYLQEYSDYTPDKYDRFPFAVSLQKYFNCVEKNLVAEYFDILYESSPKLKSLVTKKKNPTRFFLSHDIDSLYGCFGDNYKYLLKQGRIGAMMRLMFNHYLRTPDYMLLDKIMDIEDAYDVKSTFFWLVNEGRGNRLINNADYNIDDKKVKNIYNKIQARGFTHALHKSISKQSYADELKQLGPDAMPVNRNHYLRLWLPDSFDAMERSGLKADASMGFAETIGFRNNYGLPVRPWNLKEKRSYEFVEIPLQVMDSTLKFYQNKNSNQAQDDIFNFLEANKENAVISILWHNNYFFDHADPGWLDCYKTILQFIKQNNFETIDSPLELLSV